MQYSVSQHHFPSRFEALNYLSIMTLHNFNDKKKLLIHKTANFFVFKLAINILSICHICSCITINETFSSFIPLLALTYFSLSFEVLSKSQGLRGREHFFITTKEETKWKRMGRKKEELEEEEDEKKFK